MRSFCLTLGLLVLGCAGHSPSGFVVPTQPGLRQTCEQASAGSDARLRVVVVSETGDTIRHAHVQLAGYSSTAFDQPALTTDEPAASGQYELGPFQIGEYLVTVSDSGWRPARLTARFCSNSQLEVLAVLVPAEREAR